ncbi:MAG: hypothetical protein ACE5KK_03325 [Candidatus Brocadiales bacterium]
MVKEKKELKEKELKVKVAFVCDKESLLKLEEVRMAFLQKENKREGNSSLMRMAIGALYEKVCKK